MKQTKLIALVVIILITFSALQYLPIVKGQGQENSLQLRVTVLEALVESLSTRVAALEDGQVPPGTSFEVLNLKPLDEFPENPTDGDLCIKEVIEIEEIPGIREDATYIYYYKKFLWCYYDEDWRCVYHYLYDYEVVPN